ncbi:MAG: hypothetical protein KDB27_22015 [Planctomycetales bacterium]|nr:hypothetical protein [Planctomycetales bacterium]
MLETPTVPPNAPTPDSPVPRATNSTQLPASTILGSPIGSLRIGGNANRNRMIQQVVMSTALVGGTVLGLSGLIAFDVQVGRGGAKVILLFITVALWSLILLGFKLAVKTARSIDVFARGIRFNDFRDTLDGRMELAWDQFDTQFNRVEFPDEREILNDDLRQVTLKVRLAGAQLNDRSHRISVYARESDMDVVQFMMGRMHCTAV